MLRSIDALPEFVLSPEMKLRLSFILFSLFGLATSQAAVTALVGGQNEASLLQNQTDWTLDAGIIFPSLPSSPSRVIFESGGDGTGVGLVVSGSNLVLFQDLGDFSASSPADDTFKTWDISGLSGTLASLRLKGSLSGTTDTIELSILGSNAVIVADSVTLPVDIASAAGGNRLGFGGNAGDIAGIDESAEIGFPDMAQFNNALYDVDNSPVGANVLGPDSLVGTLYTGADAAPAGIPDPSSWGLIVPEPSSTLFLMFGLGAAAMRRCRK